MIFSNLAASVANQISWESTAVVLAADDSQEIPSRTLPKNQRQYTVELHKSEVLET